MVLVSHQIVPVAHRGWNDNNNSNDSSYAMVAPNMSDMVFTTLVSVLSSFVGILVGIYVARRKIKDQFFYAAAAKLKQSFTDILQLLREPPERFEVIDDSTIDAMDKSFWEHERAVFEFRYALPESKRASLDAAWNNYRGKGELHPWV